MQGVTIRRNRETRDIELCPPPIFRFFAWAGGILSTLICAGIIGIFSILLQQSARQAENTQAAAGVREDVSEVKGEVREIKNDVQRLEILISAAHG